VTDALIFRIALVPLVAVLGMVLGLLYKGIDRKIAARMQARVGPPVTQPFRDVKKLMLKENIIPRNAVPWLFNLMPVLALAASMMLLLYLPIGGLGPVLEGYGDLILVLYLLLFPSLALVIGGFSSGSPYADVGAQREMVTIMSFEFPLAVAIISLTWLHALANPGMAVFSFSVIESSAAWGLVGPLGIAGLVLLFVVMMAVMPGELGRIPFDTAEADTELAGGVLAEYSGRNLALFYLADAVKTVAMASVVIALFIPSGISGILGIGGVAGTFADMLFFLAKLFILIFIGSTLVRVAMARLRITMVVKAYWGYSTFIALAGLALIAADVLLRGAGW